MPTLYVIAGPNGIGKTTSSYDLVPANVPIINSDEIAKEARNSGIISGNAQEYSNNEANRLIQEHIDKMTSFVIETNLADIDTWKFLIGAQKLGYQLHIVYISTDSLEILNNRIAARVLQGDHFVRPDIVKERYISGLNLLNHYFNTPDKIQLFDNTSTPILIAESEFGKIIERNDVLPSWVESYLGQHFKESEKINSDIKSLSSIEEIKKIYKSQTQKTNTNDSKTS